MADTSQRELSIDNKDFVAKYAANEYLWSDVLGFKSKTKSLNKILRRAIVPRVEVDKSIVLASEIDVEISNSARRIGGRRHPDFDLQTFDILKSIGLHVIIGSLFFVSFKFFESHYSQNYLDAQPVELVFGLTDELRSTHREVDANTVAEEQEALKRPEILPQLPAQVTIKEAELTDESIPMPSTLSPKNQPTPLVKVTVTPPPGVKELSAEELLKRVEKENRKVGDKTQDGAKDAKGKKSSKELTFDVPPAPITNDIPEAPPGLVAAGQLEGRAAATAKSAYTIAVTNHIKRIWTLPQTQKFDSSIFALVGVDIDIFGKIIGDVSLVKSSGNNEFDAEALAAVKSGAPYPDLPKDLAPRMRLTIKLAPRDAN